MHIANLNAYVEKKTENKNKLTSCRFK